MSVTQNTKKRTLRRLSVWSLIFALLLLFSGAACLPVHATPILDGARNGIEDAGNAVGDMARDAKNGVENAVNDAESHLAETNRGRVKDSDGVIGNEAAENTNTSSNGENGKMSKAGVIALIVVIVAVIIAVIIMIAMLPKRRRD